MKKLLFVLLPALLGLTACENYGEKISIKKSEVYYKDGATEKEAKDLGKYLLDYGWFDEDTRKSVQLTKSDDDYQVHLVVDKDKIEGNEKALLNIWLMQLTISQNVFDNAPTRIILADEKLKDIQTMDPIAQYQAGEEAYILYNSGEYRKSDVKKVASVLEEEGFFSYKGDKEILVDKKAGTNTVQLLLAGDADNIEKTAKGFMPLYQKLQYNLQENAFEGRKTALYLTSKETLEGIKVPQASKEEMQAQQQQQYNNQTNEQQQTSDSELETVTDAPGY